MRTLWDLALFVAMLIGAGGATRHVGLNWKRFALYAGLFLLALWLSDVTHPRW